MQQSAIPKRLRFITGMIIVLSVFLIFLLLSCQKAKEPEGKKGSAVQKEEVKPPPVGEGQPQTQEQGQPGETIPTAGAPVQGQPETQAIPAEQVKEGTQTSESQGPVNFKEPVLLWEREFNPPLIDISEQNSNGEYIAIQGGGKEEKPTKILFLNSKGKTVREIALGKKEKRKIPAEQVWLTHYGEEWRSSESRKGFVEGLEIKTEVNKVIISGNGEYYGIVTRDTKLIEPEYYSPWYEFAYYDKTGKLLWKIVPQDNYGFMTAHISNDGSRVLLIDEAILDYFGQRWYLFDNNGNLLKTEDHLLKEGSDPKEMDKERAEWIMDNGSQVEFSPSANYIASVNGKNWTDSKITLRTGDGKLLWSKKFDEKGHYSVRVSDLGSLIVDGAKAQYLIDCNGKTILVLNRDEKTRVQKIGLGVFSSDGNFTIGGGEEHGESDLRIYKALTGEVLFMLKAHEINDSKTRLHDRLFISNNYIVFIYRLDQSSRKSVEIFDMKKRQTVWKKEEIDESILLRHRIDRQLSLVVESHLDAYIVIKKVMMFELMGGQDI